MAHWPNESDQIQLWDPETGAFTALEPMNIGPDINGVGKPGYHDGNPGLNTPPSIMSSKIMNMLVSEINELVIGFGGTLDEGDNSQLFKVMKAAVSARGINSWIPIGDTVGSPTSIAAQIDPLDRKQNQDAIIVTGDGRVWRSRQGSQIYQFANGPESFHKVIPGLARPFSTKQIYYALSHSVGGTSIITSDDRVIAFNGIEPTLDHGVFFRNPTFEYMFMVGVFPDVAFMAIRAGNPIGDQNYEEADLPPASTNKYIWDALAVYELGYVRGGILSTTVFIIGYVIGPDANFIWRTTTPHVPASWEEFNFGGDLRRVNLAHKDGVIAAIGVDALLDEIQVWTSADFGETWTMTFSSNLNTAPPSQRSGIISTDSLFVIRFDTPDGFQCYSSLDGVTWNYVFTPASNLIIDFAYCAGKVICIYNNGPADSNVWSSLYLRGAENI